VAFNTAFSRQRIVVEHTLSRMRRFEALDQRIGIIACGMRSGSWRSLASSIDKSVSAV